MAVNVITGNIIGPDVTGPDNIGKVGIFAQFQDNCLISNNLVQNVGGTFVGTTGGPDRVGQGAGSESWASTPSKTKGGNYTVTKNKGSSWQIKKSSSYYQRVVIPFLKSSPKINIMSIRLHI